MLYKSIPKLQCYSRIYLVKQHKCYNLAPKDECKVPLGASCSQSLRSFHWHGHPPKMELCVQTSQCTQGIECQTNKKRRGKSPPLLRSLTTIMDVYWRRCFLLAREKSFLFDTVHISTMEWTMERQPKKKCKKGVKRSLHWHLLHRGFTKLHHTTESHAREDRKVSLDNIGNFGTWGECDTFHEVALLGFEV